MTASNLRAPPGLDCLEEVPVRLGEEYRAIGNAGLFDQLKLLIAP